ncbi:unnamed protein product [Calicophoron daubneyi]|uniref:Uncharacterized protein n=1 Tax=Calicophoron daubneyi TaxID=300641 RepID=A0AAV2TZK0_CALDB
MPITIPVERIPTKYRCFGCMHVRIGTLILSVFQILVHFVVLAILTAAIGRSTRIRNEVEYVALSISVMSFIQWERFVAESNKLVASPSVQSTSSSLPVTTVNENIIRGTPTPSPPPPYLRASKFFMNAGEEYVAVAVTLFSLLFSIMMMVGAVYGRPYYLLPYCCVQFVDLFVTCLSVIGYYTYLPESDLWARCSVWVTLIIVVAGIALLALKAYLLAMVWLCYKFLTKRAAGLEHAVGLSFTAGACSLPILLCHRFGCVDCETVSWSSVNEVTLHPTVQSRGPIIVLMRGSSLTSEPEPNESCLPPKYEDAVSMPAFGPPPYSVSGEMNNSEVPTGEARTDASDILAPSTGDASR